VSKPVIRVWKSSAPARRWMEKRRVTSKVGTKKLETYVRSILREVKGKGDTALIEFTKKFDNTDLSPKNLRVTQEEIKRAYETVSEEQISAIKFMKGRVENLQKRLLEQVTFQLEDNGVKVYGSPRPIQSVGCYVPGGETAYPSTLIMIAVPAKVAGVPRVVVCTPPTGSGRVNPLTLVAADLCKVDEVYRVGGAQAVAALAYGTETLKPVRKIVGPGNRYVTMAKLLVSRDIAIDMPAGPSEILVLADGTADAHIIALDMISQAEHSIDSISGLITTSKKLAEGVTAELGKRISAIPRGGVVAEALQRNGFIILCQTMEEAIELANTFAPEHLEIVTENPRRVAERIASAGLVLLGPSTPVAASDYCLGTNHVLPTSGFSRTLSGLSVLDFIRRVNFVECSPEGLKRVRDNVKVLAETENLPNHSLAVEGRFKIE